MADAQCWAGVVEGFYGRPWSAAQRGQLFAWMDGWGLDTYLYAPKDDLKHRAVWRELYDAGEAAELRALLENAAARGLRFIYALAPGLDPDYGSAGGVAALQRKVGQLRDLGCCHFALLFDDIVPMASAGPLGVDAATARAQATVANGLLAAMSGQPEFTLLFCPTPYCGRMAGRVEDSAYLIELGRHLQPAVPVLWTGPEIISETITLESIRELAAVIGRKPVLWDNLHANDYDRRRLYLGPYSGRSLALRAEIAGVLSNPNCEFEANFVPLRTLAMWGQAREKWDPRAAYRAALSEWLPEWQSAIPFVTVEAPAEMVQWNPSLAAAAPWVQGGITPTYDALELLGDCLYLPFGHGARADGLLTDFQHLLRTPPSAWGQGFLRFADAYANALILFRSVTELKNRDLAHALYRHVWELKEELVLLWNYLQWLQAKPALGDVFTSAEHQPGTYRGGLLAELQRLLPMSEAGEFNHRPSLIPKHDPHPYR